MVLRTDDTCHMQLPASGESKSDLAVAVGDFAEGPSDALAKGRHAAQWSVEQPRTSLTIDLKRLAQRRD